MNLTNIYQVTDRHSRNGYGEQIECACGASFKSTEHSRAFDQWHDHKIEAILSTVLNREISASMIEAAREAESKHDSQRSFGRDVDCVCGLFLSDGSANAVHREVQAHLAEVMVEAASAVC